MRITAVLLLVSFAGIAIFGFLTMNHEAIGNCLASLVHGSKCLSTNSVELANFHINTFKSFSTAVFAFAAFLSFLVWSFTFPASAAAAKPFAEFSKTVSVNPSIFASELVFLSWLALHEQSPSLS